MSGVLNCGVAVAGLLESHGVDTVFGIPGVHTLELYKGLPLTKIRHVLARHEQGAGFMADGYARISGRPGVCFVITGPGVTNIATPMGQAFSDSIPMLVISSANATGDLGKGRGRLHEITDQEAVTRPLTARSVTARSYEDIVGFLDRTFEVFPLQRPRPFHIAIPLDVQRVGVEINRIVTVIRQPPKPNPALVREAQEALADAADPVVVLGGGAIGAEKQALTLIESLGAVAVTTTAGKGIIPESHPQSIGGALSLAPAHKLLAEADAVLVMGSELSETDTWRRKPLDLGGKVIRVDLDPAGLHVNAAPDIAIEAKSAAFLNALGAVESRSSAERAASRAAKVRKAIAKGRNPEERRHMAVLDVLRQVLPQDGFVFSDMTQIAYTGNCAFPVEQPRCWFHPLGYGTLGYALPAAIGAKLAAPERAGVALAGDYGFQFTMQELSTAAELCLPLPILLWNNDGLGQIRDDMVASGMPEIGVNAHNPDFPALARACGCDAAAPDNLDALGDALSAALSATRPTLIEVRHDMAGL